MKKQTTFIILCLAMFTFNAFSQNKNSQEQAKTIVENSKNLNLQPLPAIELDFETIINKNKALKRDIYDVYAWSKVYQTTNFDAFSMVKFIKNKLTAEELKIANIRFKQLLNKIKMNKLENGYFSPSKLLLKDEGDYEIIPIKTIAPEYPRKALIAKLQGYVKLVFNVYQDGSVRDIYVAQEYPQYLFSKAAVEAIAKYKFKIKPLTKDENLSDKQAATQKIEFKLAGNLPIVSEEKLTNVNSQFDLALKGNNFAKYNFINAFYSLPIEFNFGVVNRKLINDWLFELANLGYADAQYYLGEAIYNGNGCLQEKQKGFEWMLISAKQNYADAQYFLYNHIKLNDVENTSGHTAKYWLDQAANNGSIIAKLEFAKEVANSATANPSQVKLATYFLKDYEKEYGKLPQTLQIKALLLSKQGHKSKAKSAIKKAIKLAKKAAWDLTELEQQKQNIIKTK